MYMARKPRRIGKPARIGERQLGSTRMRAWREAQEKKLSLEKLAAEVARRGVKTSHASLSRIERAKQPYNQPLIEAIADILGTTPGALLDRPPHDSEGLWAVWDKATPEQRRQLLRIAKTLIEPSGS